VEQGARGWLRRGACVLVVAGLAGCESVRVLNDYRVEESADVAGAPWPRLVDVPPAPPPGRYDAGVPDPTTGAAIDAALSARTARAERRRRALSGPVIDGQGRAALGRR